MRSFVEKYSQFLSQILEQKTWFPSLIMSFNNYICHFFRAVFRCVSIYFDSFSLKQKKKQVLIYVVQTEFDVKSNLASRVINGTIAYALISVDFLLPSAKRFGRKSAKIYLYEEEKTERKKRRKMAKRTLSLAFCTLNIQMLAQTYAVYVLQRKNCVFFPCLVFP